jgi:hypothetical protein
VAAAVAHDIDAAANYDNDDGAVPCVCYTYIWLAR